MIIIAMIMILLSMKQMRKMGGMSSILSMLPGMGMSKDMIEGAVDEKQLKQTEARKTHSTDLFLTVISSTLPICLIQYHNL